MTSTIREDEKQHFADYEWHRSVPESIGLLAMVPSKCQFIQNSLLKAGVDNRTVSNAVEQTLPLYGYSVLDVGCGGGFLSHALARAGAQVVGIDVTEDHIKSNQKMKVKSSTGNCEFACVEVGTISDYYVSQNKRSKSLLTNSSLLNPFNWLSNVSSVSVPIPLSVLPPIGFDLVVASEVIEHVNNPSLFAAQLAACTKPGGLVVITTPNRNWAGYFIMITIGEHLAKVIKKGTHQYKYFIRKEELEDFYCKKQTECVKETLVRRKRSLASSDKLISTFQQSAFAVGGLLSGLPVFRQMFRNQGGCLDWSRKGPLKDVPVHDLDAMELIRSQRGLFKRVNSSGIFAVPSLWNRNHLKWNILTDRFGLINYFIAFQKER